MTNRLKKKDARGLWRFWWGEVKGQYYQTYSQVYGGQVRTSEPTHPRKNRSRSKHHQCEFELEALYTKRLRLGWKWEKERAGRKEPPPQRFFAPMLAHKYPQRQLALPFYVQPKLDGVRCIGTEHGLWSRKNSALTSIPHIRRDVVELVDKYPDITALDGELYLHGWTLPKISGLARLKSPTPESKMLQYHIFDYIPNRIGEPYEDRLARLQRIVGFSEHIKIVRTDLCEEQEDVDFLHRRYCKLGYEGSMHRRMGSMYQFQRSTSLLKRKDFLDEEARIVSVEEGNGTWRGAVKSVGLVDSKGIGFSAGVRGDLSDMQKLWAKRRGLIGQTCTFRYLYRDKKSGKPQLPVATDLHRWDLA